MCIPRVTPISATLVFNNLSKLTKFKPSPNTRMQLNKQPLRDFSAMKCGPRGQEMKTSNPNNSLMTCPVLTYFSIISVFASMVVMNNIHGSQHPSSKIQHK